MRIRHLLIQNFRGIKTLSWKIEGDFNCIIGPGDTCKTTILTALDYALTPRTYLSFDDSDFFNQDVTQDIVIQATLSDWDENAPEVREFFKASKFGRCKCGLDNNGPLPEPVENGPVAISISLRVDKTLEPKWSIVQGKDENAEQDRKPIYAGDRAILGVSRIDITSDFHFTWGRNTILTRLSGENRGNISSVISELARTLRQSEISDYQGIVECQAVAATVRLESRNMGVSLNELSPQIDIQRQSMTSGALSLHEGEVPLRNKGSGSKKLISTAMQMKLRSGKSISLIDEIEIGLEPHRIRGLIFKLKNSQQQIFTTTHSPVVIRELKVSDGELFVCKRDQGGNVTLAKINLVPCIQSAVRSNAEAFLGRKIIVCEGPTEIGCLRAADTFYFKEDQAPVWSLGTSYYNAAGIDAVKTTAEKLNLLGYKVAVLCDNDEPTKFTAQDKTQLEQAGIMVFQWNEHNSTEDQIFQDIPWPDVPDFINEIISNRDFLEITNLVGAVKDKLTPPANLSYNPSDWAESPELRVALGKAASKHRVIEKEKGWIKRIECSEAAFKFLLPKLAETSLTRIKLKSLWEWIQNDG